MLLWTLIAYVSMETTQPLLLVTVLPLFRVLHLFESVFRGKSLVAKGRQIMKLNSFGDYWRCWNIQLLHNTHARVKEFKVVIDSIITAWLINISNHELINCNAGFRLSPEQRFLHLNHVTPAFANSWKYSQPTQHDTSWLQPKQHWTVFRVSRKQPPKHHQPWQLEFTLIASLALPEHIQHSPSTTPEPCVTPNDFLAKSQGQIHPKRLYCSSLP